jgi:hypothetical protein
VPFGDLTFRTDRPDGLTADVNWVPYLSGFPLAGWYVLARTFPDPIAARAGMVFTHALIADLDEICAGASLEHLVPLLRTSPDRTSSALQSVTLDISSVRPPRLLTPGVKSILRGLLDRTDSRPVVWLGQEEFDNAAIDTWASLWPSARRGFAFRLCLTRSDADTNKLSLLSTPVSLATRWDQHAVLRPGDREGYSHSPGVAYLVRESDMDPLAILFSQIGSQPATLADVQLAERTLPFLASPRVDVAKIRQAIRSVAKLSPSSQCGAEFKDELQRSLAELTIRASATDVLALRNFADQSAYPDNGSSAGEAVAAWVYNAATQATILPNGSAVDVDRLLVTEQAESWWKAAVSEGIRRAIKEWPTRMPTLLWTWWKASPANVGILAIELPMAAEQSLAEACPATLPQEIATAALALAREKRWPVVHGVVLTALHDGKAAVLAQTAEPWMAKADAFRAMARRAPIESVIEAALVSDDAALTSVAGELCASDFRLLTSLDASNARWRAIWVAAIGAGAHVWDGIPDARAARNIVFQSLESGEYVSKTLMEAIANSLHGNLLELPGRDMIWGRLEANVARVFLDTTAEAWWDSLDSGAEAVETLEEPLLTRVLAPSRLRVRLNPRSLEQVDLALRLFSETTRLAQVQLIQWIEQAAAADVQLTRSQSTAVGRLVQRRGWKDIARILVQLAARRPQWQSALSECRDLLGPLDRLLTQLFGSANDSLSKSSAVARWRDGRNQMARCPSDSSKRRRWRSNSRYPP